MQKKKIKNKKIDLKKKKTFYSLTGNLNKDYPKAEKGKDVYIITKDNRKVLDGSSGAAVSCIGHGNRRVIKAIKNQCNTGVTYASSTF